MFQRVYKQLQLLSIDVAFGACTMSYLVSEVLGISIPLIIYFSLGSSVWLTYTMDHILDANTNTKQVITARHTFHQKYFKQLIIIWLFVFMFTALLSLIYLPVQTIYFGVIAVVLVIIHLVLVKLLGNKISIFIQKELGIAVTYSLGVLIGPLSMMVTLPSYLYLVIVQIFVLAFINLIEFSYFESETDTKQGQSSLVHNIGELNVTRLLYVLIGIGAGLNFVSLFFYEEYFIFQILLTSMFFVLATIFLNKSYFNFNERYRLWGDAVFLFPSILLFI